VRAKFYLAPDGPNRSKYAKNRKKPAVQADHAAASKEHQYPPGLDVEHNGIYTLGRPFGKLVAKLLFEKNV